MLAAYMSLMVSYLALLCVLLKSRLLNASILTGSVLLLMLHMV